MNEDFDLDLGDEPEDETQTEDELLRYLEPEDEVEDEEEKKAKAAKDEEDRLQAIVDRKIADRFMGPAPTAEKPKPAQSAPEQAPADVDKLLEAMADDIVNDLALDPKAAVRKVLQATRAMANQSGETASARANRLAIEQFRTSRRDDPLFKAISTDFDTEVEAYSDAQLGKATPTQLRKALELAEESALGRYYRKQLTEKKTRQAAEPPKYGGGTSGGSGTRGVNTQLSTEQRKLIRMGKSAGLSDKDIRELVRENK